jgi:hypothetical protein
MLHGDGYCGESKYFNKNCGSAAIMETIPLAPPTKDSLSNSPLSLFQREIFFEGGLKNSPPHFPTHPSIQLLHAALVVVEMDGWASVGGLGEEPAPLKDPYTI